MRRLLALTDFLLRHRVHISAFVLLVGCVLAGIPVPMPWGGTFEMPTPWPSLVPFGYWLAGLGSVGGGLAMLSRYLRIAPDQAAKLDRAVKAAAKSGATVQVKTRADLPDVEIVPIPPKWKRRSA
jgi:hypothetical protein